MKTNLTYRRTGGCLAFILAAIFAVGCETMPDPNTLPPGNENSNTNENANDNVAASDEVVDPGLDGIELEMLISQSSVKPVIAYDGAVPSHVEVRVPIANYSPEEPVSSALEFLETYQHFYRLEEPAAELVPGRLHQDATGEHVFFRQQLNGTFVHGAHLAVHMQDGMVVGTNGHYLQNLQDFGEPKIDMYRAIDIATRDAGGHPNDLASAVTLIIYDGKLLGLKDGETRLAWRMAVRPDCDEGSCESYEYIVDATTGDIIFSQSRIVYCDKDFDINHANETTSNTCWNRLDETSDDEMYDEDGRWCGVFEGCATTTADGFAAYNGAHRIYDYFSNTFGRCGWDNDDAQLEAMVHVRMFDSNGNVTLNASYDRGCDHLKFSTGMVTPDIFYHEYVHAITRWTSGLPNSMQGGALNEHYSDFFASMVDGNWTLGEGSATGILRDMSNPPANNHPDHMTIGIGFRTLPNNAANDDGGVHINNGIPNKAAFLLTDGGTHNGITVTGIGREKAMRLFYYVLTGRLSSGSQFIDARNATVSLAREWALNNQTNGFTMQDVCNIINAYASVGLGSPDVDCDGYDDAEDTDDDNDGVPDGIDTCLRVKNPGNEDNDRDGQGDACDGDDDNDGVPDTTDGCPFNANPDQADTDGDGFMDACDNCPSIASPDQTNIDGDAQGDICDADDDNDGWLDGDDNCPTIHNPSQADKNGNGVGFLCDSDELKVELPEVKPEFQSPIIPDDCLACGDYYNWRVNQRLEARVPLNVNYRVIDEIGAVVAKPPVVAPAAGEGFKVFMFDVKPSAGSFYRFPDRAGNSRFTSRLRRDARGRRRVHSNRYFLEAMPSENAPIDLSPFEMKVQTGILGL